MDKKTMETAKKVVGWATLAIGVMMILNLTYLATVLGYRMVVGVILLLAGYFHIKK